MSDISKYLDKYLSMMKIEYVDCLEFHSPKFAKIPILDAYIEMQKLVDNGKVKYLGISNCNLGMLKELNNKVKISIFDGVYNLECKINEDIGILEYCKENYIKVVCYQPLRRNRTASRNYPFLVELANKYNKMQNQIILNWMVKEKGIIPIIKTTTMQNIKENVSSLDFEIEKEDMQK